ncbi:hypothetical protein JTB14_011633 [Gonioctena quinquepunctata]|nr:hypothetical protein JTB14_011633 [Gonioctena quinquepunctata]
MSMHRGKERRSEGVTATPPYAQGTNYYFSHSRRVCRKLLPREQPTFTDITIITTKRLRLKLYGHVVVQKKDFFWPIDKVALLYSQWKKTHNNKKYLGLSDPEKYTGQCLRLRLLAKAGASMTTLKRHGGWKSTSVADN